MLHVHCLSVLDLELMAGSEISESATTLGTRRSLLMGDSRQHSVGGRDNAGGHR